MTTPTGTKKTRSAVNPNEDAERLAARRRADAEARRQIEEANRLAREREVAYQARQAERQAAERAEAEEKEAEARAKAEAKAEAARAKAAAREAAAEEKAQARAAAAEEKAAVAAEKKARAAQRAEEKAKLSALKKRLKDEAQDQTKQWGAPLADLVGGFVQAFARRPDIHVLSQEPPAPLELEELLAHQDLPSEILSFYQRLGAFRFAWAFGEDEPVVGRIEVPELECLCVKDEPRVALGPDGPSAPSLRLLFEPSLSRAFVDENGSAELDRLDRESALAWSTPTCLIEGIVDKGLSPAQAKSLVHALGPSARLLLHRLETKEGKRREELLHKVDVSDGAIHRWLLEAMNAGPALEKAQWQKVVRDHQSFLEQGGGGGAFEFHVRQGLPSLAYHHPSPPHGQALLACENLTRAKFDGANLSYAGFAGVRGDNVSFAKADLSHANLTYSVLSGAKFSSAKLVECDFTSCKLVGANFRGADLTGTNFERADLSGANFSGALTNKTRFGGALMKNVKY